MKTNIKYTLALALSVIVAIPAFAIEYRQLTDEEKKLISAKYQDLSPEDRAKRAVALEIHHLHRGGGRMLVPGTPHGSIRIVNLQKKVDVSTLEGVSSAFSSLQPYDLKIVDKDCNADLKITLLEDPSLPSLSLWPDDGRAVINVTKLIDDKAKSKPAFLSARIRKQILRAFAYMTAGSMYGSPVLNPIKEAKELDDYADDAYPMDVILRANQYLKKKGVVPAEMVSYKLLIQRGYDIAPTNEYQKVIYDQVKAGKAKIK